METGILKLNGIEIKYSFLKDNEQHWMQVVYTIVPEKPEQIVDQIKNIEKAEKDFFKKHNLGKETPLFKRFFSSDLINHNNEIDNYKKRQDTDFFMSVTEQPPATGAKVALLGMCLSNITKKYRKDNLICFDTTSDIKHIFLEHIVDASADEHSDSEKQTENIFNYLRDKLSGYNATLEDNVLRTWIYSPHIDADYSGIVKARKELFDSINLTKDTHYIASTGIQGGSSSQFARVFMDAYAVAGINQKKVRYIQAPEYLSPTHIYGVTFERATTVELGNTDFLFISGTASIDKKGDIVHPGDVVRQAERTLQNVTALIDYAGFVKDDLSSFIVYLRDPADYEFVKPIIDNYSSRLPAVYVKAQVCRPGWLIEIEATAAKLLN
ncbi:Rid family hydrolase [candidate division KSB1 bacterium]